MGYRSEVAIAFYSKDEEHSGVIKLWMESNFPYDDWKEFENAVQVKESPEYMFVFHIDYIKWYSDYPEVKRIERLMRDFDELFCSGENPIGACEYVRIGEETDDNETETHGDPDYILEIHRSISINI
jgi:hypothetical protein